MSGKRLAVQFLGLALPILLVSLGNYKQLLAEKKKAKHSEQGMAYFDASQASWYWQPSFHDTPMTLVFPLAHRWRPAPFFLLI